MLCINHICTEPYFNMATEEYILTGFTDDVFLLWRNEPAIIVGRHQNARAEINIDFVTDNGIKVVRRLTGGGAVFHDLGNINFTFVKNGTDPDFRKFTRPIIDMLQSMGVDACFEGRNDLTIGGKKISGNAMTVSGGRTLEHGTLLFSSRMADLSAALKPNPVKFEDKAVKSVRSRVTNISEHLPYPMTVSEFKDAVMKYMLDTSPDCKPYDLSPADMYAIGKLRDEKYAGREWNFGRSPEYKFVKGIKTGGGAVEFHLNIDKGNIADIRIFGDFFGRENIADLENAIKGCRHTEEAVNARLASINISDYIMNATREEVVKGII